jgi:hypothetical protein
MKEALKDGRCWSCFGIVRASEDGSVFEIAGDDVLVEVELQPNEERITARLGSVAGGPGRGVWAVPPEGTEVAVLVPDGDPAFMPVIVATLTSGETPADLDETTVVIANNLGDIAVIPSGDVSLGEAGATEQALRGNSFQTKFNTLVTAYNAHTHAIAGAVGTASPPNNASPTFASTAAELSPNVRVK